MSVVKKMLPDLTFSYCNLDGWPNRKARFRLRGKWCSVYPGRQRQGECTRVRALYFGSAHVTWLRITTACAVHAPLL